MQCNVITENIAKNVNAKIVPSKTKRIISYSGHTTPIIGETSLWCGTKNSSAEVKFKIVRENLKPILGRVSCTTLGLVARVNTIAKKIEFGAVFDGLGCYKDFEYDIDLIDDPKFKIHPPRKIPHALRDQVKKALDDMEQEGVCHLG